MAHRITAVESARTAGAIARIEVVMSAGAAAAAAVVAARAAEEARREEEEMTPYSKQDLDDGWEFKFVRSATGKFRDPAWQRAILEEEARAGWTLIEKFDNTRLRLKRPTSARERDVAAPIDPYRIWVGTTPNMLAVYVLLAVFVGIGLLLLLIFSIVFFFVSPHGLR
jgi:hypothetical protein